MAVQCEERSLAPDGRSGEGRLIRCEEGSLVAALLETNILAGYLVNNRTPSPYVFHKC